MILLTILLIFLMLFISSILAATETAITAASPAKLHKAKTAGHKRADIALKILKIKEKVINTMLIGNSFMNTLCTTIATGLFIEIIGDPNLGTILSSAIMTFLIIVFAEAVPKAIAVIKAENILLFNARIVLVFINILSPINKLLDIALKIFCFILRIKIDKELSVTEEVRGIIQHHHDEGKVYKTDRDMLEGILDIRDMNVSEIMIHRSQINSLNIDLEKSKIIHHALKSPNTRIPIWKDTSDNIIGILHIKDLLRCIYDNNNDITKVDINKLLSKPWFIPDNTLVVQQLNAFKERKNHLAIVIDEYSALQGIVTLEDILEEIVGPIQDEHDEPDKKIKKSDDSNDSIIVDGTTTIRDINREMNWNLPDDDATTIAGLIIHKLEHIPNQGESIKILNFKCTVTKKIGNKVSAVKIKVLPIVSASEEDK